MWLSWYAAHEDANGFVTDYRHTDGSWLSTGRPGLHRRLRRHVPARGRANLRRGSRRGCARRTARRRSPGRRGHRGDPGRRRAHLGHAVVAREVPHGPGGDLRRPACRGDARRRPGRRGAWPGGPTSTPTGCRPGVDGLWNAARGPTTGRCTRTASGRPPTWPSSTPTRCNRPGPSPSGLFPDRVLPSSWTASTHAQPGWDDPTSPAPWTGRHRSAGYWVPAAWAMAQAGRPGVAGAAGDRILAAADAAGRSLAVHACGRRTATRPRRTPQHARSPDDGDALPASRADTDDSRDVRRVKGTNRLETAVAVAHEGWGTATHVLLATADAFPDALAAGALAARLDAPLLLTSHAALPNDVQVDAQTARVDEVTIVGGPAAVSDAVVADPAPGRLRGRSVGRPDALRNGRLRGGCGHTGLVAPTREVLLTSGTRA